MYILLVSGSRVGVPEGLVNAVLTAHHNLAHEKGLEFVIMHGCARGVDSQAEAYANWNGVRTLQYPADWHLYDKRAGSIRNGRMAQQCCDFATNGHVTACAAFPRGASYGTRNMIKQFNSKCGDAQVWEVPD